MISPGEEIIKMRLSRFYLLNTGLPGFMIKMDRIAVQELEKLLTTVSVFSITPDIPMRAPSSGYPVPVSIFSLTVNSDWPIHRDVILLLSIAGLPPILTLSVRD